MTPHETALVTVLLERLKKIDSAPNDPQAETLIRERTADQPHTAYHLVQTVLIQDLSLHVAQNRIAELEKSAAEAQRTAFLPLRLLLDESNRTTKSPAEAKTTTFLPAGLLLDESNPGNRSAP
jgi:hypothetical protein